MKRAKIIFMSVALMASAGAFAIGEPAPGASTGLRGARYATDAYPGFDSEDSVLSPERKEPRWFSFIFGPNRDNPADQLSYCTELMAGGDFKKAVSQLDALVREWPTSSEAPKAQRAMADLLLNKLLDFEEAFSEYRYLMDFYSLQIDYEATADLLYKVAALMKAEGKEIMFIRFANTVDVRRAYEACVLHAPGASWAPAAMLTIATLREDEGKYSEAVKVYENLRNLHPTTEEAKVAVIREVEVRMLILRDFGYNRDRCRDTLDFMTLAQRKCREEDVSRIGECLDEVRRMIDENDYLCANFYDSRTRTPRSAIRAYEKYLRDHPDGAHADEVRERLEKISEKEDVK